MRLPLVLLLLSCSSHAPANPQPKPNQTPSQQLPPVESSMPDPDSNSPLPFAGGEASAEQAHKSAQLPTARAHETAITSEQEANVAFDVALKKVVVPHLNSTHPKVASFWSPVSLQALRSAAPSSCASQRELITNAVGATAHEHMLYGEVDWLADGRECWTVVETRGFASLVMIFDSQTGQLLLVWEPPEG